MASSASLNRLALSGVIWTIAGYGASQVMRFGGNLILTRLLLPEYFGLMALVNIPIIGLQLFSDVGIIPSIVQNKRGDEPAFYNTAWTLQIVRGFGLWLFCLAIAYPTAQFYNEPRLLWLIPVVGLTTILNGFESTAVATLRRHVDLAKTIKFDALMQAASLIFMIIWAGFSPTIWALVGGNLVAAALRTARSFWLIPGYRNQLCWDKDSLRDLFSFGRWIFISTALTFLATQADRLILGKYISITMLGIYTIAFTLSDIPRQVIGALGTKVIFPVVSRTADLPRPELRTKILKKRWLLLMGSALLLSGVVGFGDLFILTLYDNRYRDAAWMVPVMSFGLWHTLLYSTMNPCLLSVGKSVYGAWGNLLRFGAIALGIPYGFEAAGLWGGVLAITFSDLPMYGVVLYGLEKERLGCWRQDVQATAVFLGLLAAVLGLRLALGWGLPAFGGSV
ncbi:oligosaccharide flippase family protein [Thermoleptolyngbya sp. M55_K2018_002]|uniref:oligosaccharide flippase family protein n=1 Tax=Thermoleptolyngbya sp. M55_K2018_002 TaxID=2747808 RepID=UPI001A0697D4|nr:oligosaccharide flippase family protein [Thermoleptolyngbya sp. M55_K2018_002]HIK39398.1 oligosaccharide flippase family protein [Thermoleptolyngbya sp. M55_K2018_002]